MFLSFATLYFPHNSFQNSDRFSAFYCKGMFSWNFKIKHLAESRIQCTAELGPWMIIFVFAFVQCGQAFVRYCTEVLESNLFLALETVPDTWTKVAYTDKFSTFHPSSFDLMQYVLLVLTWIICLGRVVGDVAHLDLIETVRGPSLIIKTQRSILYKTLTNWERRSVRFCNN